MSLIGLAAKNLVHSLTKRCTQLSTISNHKYMLFYRETKRYFSGNIEQIVVPNLGDSITEGTVSSIHKQIGEKVETDDIVLEIETDKVSVDIRAPQTGYIAQFFTAIDQDVEVGGALYALSSEPVDGVDPATIKPQEATKQPTVSVSPSLTPPAAAPKLQSIPKMSESHDSHRKPLIQFRYGTREWIDEIINGFSTQIDGDSIPFWDLPKELKRTGWREEDIEAVNTGGANFAELSKSNYDY